MMMQEGCKEKDRCVNVGRGIYSNEAVAAGFEQDDVAADNSRLYAESSRFIRPKL